MYVIPPKTWLPWRLRKYLQHAEEHIHNLSRELHTQERINRDLSQNLSVIQERASELSSDLEAAKTRIKLQDCLMGAKERDITPVAEKPEDKKKKAPKKPKGPAVGSRWSRPGARDRVIVKGPQTSNRVWYRPVSSVEGEERKGNKRYVQLKTWDAWAKKATEVS